MKYTSDQTRQHFTEICECIWNKILSEQKLDKKTAASMRQFVANFSMMAWNMSLISPSLEATRTQLLQFAKQMYNGDHCAVSPMYDAAELKWHEYRDDKGFIARAEVLHLNGIPALIVTLKGEDPEIESVFQQLKDSIPQGEIEKQLSGVPPEMIQSELTRIASEYVERFNANQGGKPEKKTARGKKQKNAYVFRVALSDDGEIYSDILIRADQTFEDLHGIIFEAFNREEEHLYCFDIGGTRISSPECEFEYDELNASKTKLKEMNFEVGDSFGYLFDFGDEWRHDIELQKITPVKDGETYPQILNSHGEVPPQYEDDEPPAVMHPELLKIVRQICPQWNGDPDCVFVDEHDNIPPKRDVKNFVRGKLTVSVMGSKSSDFPVEFQSLQELFRKDTMDDAYSNNFLLSFIRNIIDGLVEKELIPRVDNERFVEIFSAMSSDPDSPSQSFLHDMIWTASACFLLQYECSRKEFSRILRRLIKAIRKNTEVTFYDFCLGNFGDGEDE